MKKIFFSFSFAAILFSISVASPTYAQDASPAPAASSSGDQTKQGLMDHISKIMEQRREQVKGVMDKLGQQKRGFIAEVKGVMGTNLTVSNPKGTQILTITSNIIIVKENKKATIDDIAIGDWVIVMGYTDAQGNFSARRIIVSSQPLQPTLPDTVVGTLQTINRISAVFLPRRSQAAGTYLLNSATHYQDFQGKSITLSGLKVDTEYLVLSTTNKDQRTATLIYSLAPPAQPTPSPTLNNTSGGQ